MEGKTIFGLTLRCSSGYFRATRRTVPVTLILCPFWMIHDEAELIANLRTQLSVLNDYAFTDAEWERFFKTSTTQIGRASCRERV